MILKKGFTILLNLPIDLYKILRKSNPGRSYHRNIQELLSRMRVDYQFLLPLLHHWCHILLLNHNFSCPHMDLMNH